MDSAKRLRAANAAQAAAEKIVKTEKAIFSRFLQEEKGITVETMPVGEELLIQTVIDGKTVDVLRIEIGKANLFDEEGFKASDPDTYAKWIKEFPRRKFKALTA